jgi:hypothetical protein
MNRREINESTPHFFGLDEFITPDPFYHPPRVPMGFAARNACAACPTPSIQTVVPPMGVDPLNPANNRDLLGMGRESDYADYAFNSGLAQRFCGARPNGQPDCQRCGCVTLRDPCVFQSGAWAQPGCDRGWFQRDHASFLSPNNGNIGANIRWG